MSQPIKITPELLADIEAKAEAAESIMPSPWQAVGDYDDLICHKTKYMPPHDRVARACNTIGGHYIAAANPATVLAMSKEINRLWAAQCWAIVTIETGVIDGPYATKEAAENERLAELCDDPNEPMYRVEPWKGGAE